MEKCFSQQVNGIVEFCVIQEYNVRAPACLLEGSIEYVDAVFVGKHVSFNDE